MFWSILKKDLKRKKTMNVVLLLFVVLCSMFASASVNNIIAVTGGIEHYFDEAGVPDLRVINNGLVANKGEWNDAEDRIRSMPSVSEVKTEHMIGVVSAKYFKLHGEKIDNFINPAFLISADEMAIKYFDEDNNVIKDVDKGCFYATSVFIDGLDIEKGDVVELTLGDTTAEFRYMGRLKGAVFGTQSTDNPVLLINGEDHAALYAELYSAEEKYPSAAKAEVYYVSTSDPKAIADLEKEYDGLYVQTREDLKGIYLYDMIAAYIMMIISVALMLTAFVVLRFTIGFTISEEFREIGVMKAVGINNRSIRRLYIVKYIAVSAIGALIGFLGSLPLGDMMMKTVSENMVLGGRSSRLMGLLSSGAVVIIIVFFCYNCTRRIKKLSPIDAVRNGQTGERFGKRSILHLGRSKLPSTGFLALNDVLSAPKQFAIMTVIFTLCVFMISLMSNFALTLKSEKILWLFDIPTSEIQIIDTEMISDLIMEPESWRTDIPEYEKLLADNGINARCTMTLSGTVETSLDGKTEKLSYSVIRGDTDDTLRVEKGSAPRKADEVAMTISALNALDAQIGDKVTAVIGDKEYEFIITGMFSSFGTRSVFLHSDFDDPQFPVDGSMGLQIHLDEKPDKAQLNEYIEKIKVLFDTDKVYSTSDMIKTLTGISGTLETIKKMLMILTAIVTALIVVLMERSFISKEKSEIALMKAVGIRGRSIVLQHTLRFVFVSVLACILALAILMPLSDLLMNWVCLLIGDVSGIKCDYDPIEIFLICPALMIGITTLGAWLTALYTGTVKASDTASIE